MPRRCRPRVSTGTDRARIETRPFASALGAEVREGGLGELDESGFASLHRAWLEHLLIVVHGQQLDDSQLVRFGRRFGPLKRAPLHAVGGALAEARAAPGAEPEIHVVSNVEVDGAPIGILGADLVGWHTDMASFERPPSATVLYALEVPERGGDTSFSNMYLAHDTLPGKLRRRLLGYTVHHRVKWGSSEAGAGARHPLVRTHPQSGHNALYLGARQNTSIPQLTTHESDRILDFLWAHATLPEFGHRHRWARGDLLVWDNRCTVHYREPFDARQRRLLKRVQIEGESAPGQVPDAASRPPHPRGLAWGR